jgi:molybdopterin/thiamine biosynthesis adenylyltransferase
VKQSVPLGELLNAVGALDIVPISQKDGYFNFKFKSQVNTWSFSACWPDSGNLPKFYLDASHCDKHRPHVAWYRLVCYNDGEGLFFADENLESVLLESLQMVTKVLDDGDTDGLSDFLSELEGYMAGIDNSKFEANFQCYFALENTPQQITAYCASKKSLKFKCYLEKKQCWGVSKNDWIKFAAKKSPAQTVRGYYLPLDDQQVNPPLPGKNWTFDDVLQLVGRFIPVLPELKNYLKKPWQRYIFSFPRKNGECGAFGILVNKNGAIFNVYHTPVYRFHKDYLQKRASLSVLDIVKSLRVAVIGCGSVGSMIAQMLTQNGFNNLSLVDPEIYSADNIYRHILPKYFVGGRKSAGLKMFLESAFVDLSLTEFSGYGGEWATPENIQQHDLIILATGNHAFERQLLKAFKQESSSGQMIMSVWNEALGLGGHVVMHRSGQCGCLNCLYFEAGSQLIHPQVSFINPGQKVSQNLTGCGGAFSPFSGNDSRQTAILATRTIESALANPEQSIYDFWRGDERQAKGDNIHRSPVYENGFPEKDLWWDAKTSTGCPVCRNQ